MPEFPRPGGAQGRRCRAIQDDINQYAITWGAHGCATRSPSTPRGTWVWTVDPETEITVTCGSTEAMLVDPARGDHPGRRGDLFEPFYENYWPDCVLAGATPAFRPAAAPGWTVRPRRAGRRLQRPDQGDHPLQPEQPDRDGASPGTELEAIAALCRKWDVIAITDEIYEHIIYDGRRTSRSPGLDGMRERTVTISGMSKTYGVTGWRVGRILAPDRLTEPFGRSTTSSPSAPRRRSRRA